MLLKRLTVNVFVTKHQIKNTFVLIHCYGCLQMKT